MGTTIKAKLNNPQNNFKEISMDKNQAYIDALNPYNTIYAQVLKVAKDGLSRDMAFFTINNDEIIDITYSVFCVLNNNDKRVKRTKKGLVKIFGSGMNMVEKVGNDLNKALNREVKTFSMNSYLR